LTADVLEVWISRTFGEDVTPLRRFVEEIAAAVPEHPYLWRGYLSLGNMMHHHERDPEAALGYFDRALSLAPDEQAEVEIRKQRVRTLWSMDRCAEVRAELERIIACESCDVSAEYVSTLETLSTGDLDENGCPPQTSKVWH
jgi:hypothetical protein